jgi:hypothetical protein
LDSQIHVAEREKQNGTQRPPITSQTGDQIRSPAEENGKESTDAENCEEIFKTISLNNEPHQFHGRRFVLQPMRS